MKLTFGLQSEGRVQKEATYINKSLSFLEQAIIALVDQKRDHIPFRQCKLTHALKDSLGEGVAGAQGEGTGTAATGENTGTPSWWHGLPKPVHNDLRCS